MHVDKISNNTVDGGGDSNKTYKEVSAHLRKNIGNINKLIFVMAGAVRTVDIVDQWSGLVD